MDFNCEPLQSQLNIDWSHDLYNYKHLNWYGAKKYTDYVSEYLSEEYDLPNHSEESEFDSWHKAVDDLNHQIE